MTFEERGARIAAGGHEMTLAAAAIGRDGALMPLQHDMSPTTAAAEVRTDRGHGVVEWWRSLASGLEHGVTIAERPEGDGELVVEMAVSGFSARSKSDDVVDLLDTSGTSVARYANLAVVDAHGLRVPAAMRAT